MYRIFSYTSGSYHAEQRLCRHVFVDGVVLPVSMTQSRAQALVSASNYSVFSVRKNGAEIGKMIFTGSSNLATFASMSAATTFADGDRLSVMVSGSADNTLADVAITFFGERYL